jgi:hypothetical protein
MRTALHGGRAGDDYATAMRIVHEVVGQVESCIACACLYGHVFSIHEKKEEATNGY